MSKRLEKTLGRLVNLTFVVMQLASWILALYLFTTGNNWGGLGCAFIAIGTLAVVLFTTVILVELRK